MKKLCIAICILVASVNISYAACSWNGNIGTAASLTTTEVGYCITDAGTKTGEVTINLPAGTQTWASTVTVNMTSGFANVTALNIIGNGTIPTGTNKGSAENTIVNSSGLGSAFTIVGSSAKKIRIANIKFTGSYSGYNGVIYITGTSKPSTDGGFRIDHNNFNTTIASGGPRVIKVYGYTYGVIDHNNYYSPQMANTIWEGDGIGANKSWNRAISVGTQDAVYLEDNIAVNTGTYINRMFCDGENGARIVVRYNDITNMYLGGHDATTSYRGIVQYEAYNNTIRLADIDFTDSGHYDADPRAFLRGGTQIFYNNTFLETEDGSPHTGYMWTSTSPILLQNNRSMTGYGYISPWGNACDNSNIKICLGTLHSTQYPSTTGDYCTTDADCGGESGSCQNQDGNSDGTGYPCRDQIGVAPDGTISGQLTHYPSLFWANTYNGTTTDPVIRNSANVRTHIQNDRDICYHSTTMPATCGGHATTYTAYTYPHPLTGGGGGEGDTTAPSSFSAFVTTEQACTSNPRDVSIGISTNEPATCKWDTSVDGSPTYAELSNTFTGTGTTTHTGTVSAACGATTTIYYACQDAIPNTTAVSSWTFTVAPEEDTTTPVITSVTSAKQAVALTQKLSITTQVGASCRYCVDGVGGCTSATAWADRTAFSVTGGSTTHHEVAITQAASSSATYNVICQNTQGTATSANSEITITTDAAKTITAGAGSLSITQGSGSLSVTILP
jgi:hypothetical protein